MTENMTPEDEERWAKKKAALEAAMGTEPEEKKLPKLPVVSDEDYHC